MTLKTHEYMPYQVVGWNETILLRWQSLQINLQIECNSTSLLMVYVYVYMYQVISVTVWLYIAQISSVTDRVSIHLYLISLK